MPQKIEINVETGEQIVVEMTPEEVAALQAAAEPPQIPQTVTRFQARAALYQAGLLTQVETAIAAPDTDMMLKLAWQDAQTFKRDSQFIIGMAQKLDLSAQQLDGLFTAASKIE